MRGEGKRPSLGEAKLLLGVGIGLTLSVGVRALTNRTFDQQCVAAYQATTERRAAPDSASFRGHQRFPDSYRVAAAFMTVTHAANPQKVQSQRLDCYVNPAGMVVVSAPHKRATPDEP